MKLSTLNVGMPKIVEDVAAEHATTTVVTDDGWVNTYVDGIVVKAPLFEAVA